MTWTGVQGGKYYLIDTVPRFDAMMEELRKHRLIALDTETSGLSVTNKKDDVCGISIGAGVAFNFYIPINHKTHEKQLKIEQIREDLNKFFQDPEIVTILSNAKFDLHGLRKLGIEVTGVIHDTLVMSFLLDENADHGLKEQAVAYIDPHADRLEANIKLWRVAESKRRRSELSALIKAKTAEILQTPLSDLEQRFQLIWDEINPRPEGKFPVAKAKELAKRELAQHPNHKNKISEISYDLVPITLMAPYAAADVHYTLLLYKKFVNDLTVYPKLVTLYLNEIQLLKELFEAESLGAKIDRKYLESLGPEYNIKLENFKKEIWNEVGREFNIDSDKELIKVFTEKDIKLTKLTKGSKEKAEKGETENLQYSVDTEVLEKLAIHHPFASKIVSYNKMNKLKNTYIEGILEVLDSEDFVHTSYTQNVSSGRMSCIAKGTLIEVVRDVSKYPKGIPIEDIKIGDLVYCYDSELKLRIKPVIWAGKTGTGEVIRLHWKGQGNKYTGYVELTPEHKVRLTTGKYKRADHLKPGDSVMALSRGYSCGYARLYRTGDAPIEREHRFIYEELSGTVPNVVHHIDENKLNNLPENLVNLTVKQHMEMHPMSDITKSKMSKAVLKKWFLDRESMMVGVLKHSGKNAWNYKGFTKEEIVNVLWANFGAPTKVASQLGTDFSTIKRYIKEYNIDYKKIAKSFTKNNELITEDFVNEARIRFKKVGQDQFIKERQISYYRWKEIQETFNKIPYNHKIVKIEKIGKIVDVFDLTIEDEHNFIANEICVHNSKEINLTNVPTKDKAIKKAFIIPDPENYVWIFGDYKQIELKILAHLSQDPELLACYPFDGEGIDVHTLTTASCILGVSYEEACRLKREEPEIFEPAKRLAKILNFGAVYGVGGSGLSQQISTPLRFYTIDECQRYIDAFFNKFKLVKKYFQNTRNIIKTYGYIENSYGRKRRLEESFKYKLKWQQEGDIRSLNNFTIQGEAADLFKVAIVRAANILKQHKAKTRLVNFVHDEISFYWHKQEFALLKEIKDAMEDFPQYSVPVEIELAMSTSSWADKKVIL